MIKSDLNIMSLTKIELFFVFLLFLLALMMVFK
jgi:hypothetical protein